MKLSVELSVRKNKAITILLHILMQKITIYIYILYNAQSGNTKKL